MLCCCALYATKEPILTPGFSPLWQILMSASPLHVPWAPPAWMRSMDIAAYAHQTGLDPTAKKVAASTRWGKQPPTNMKMKGKKIIIENISNNVTAFTQLQENLAPLMDTSPLME